MNETGSSGFKPLSIPPSGAANAAPAATINRSAENTPVATPRSVHQDQPEDLPRARAERVMHADVARTAEDGRRNDTVDANRGDREREQPCQPGDDRTDARRCRHGDTAGVECHDTDVGLSVVRAYLPAGALQPDRRPVSRGSAGRFPYDGVKNGDSGCADADPQTQHKVSSCRTAVLASRT